MYADRDALAAYLHVDPSTLLPEVDRLLEDAEDLINYAIMGRYDADIPEYVTAVKKAVCAQVEYWMQVGDDSDIANDMPQSFTIGSFSMTMGANKGTASGGMPPLAPRARRYLAYVGLLSRKVSRRIYPDLAEEFFRKPWEKF